MRWRDDSVDNEAASLYEFGVEDLFRTKRALYIDSSLGIGPVEGREEAGDRGHGAGQVPGA